MSETTQIEQAIKLWQVSSEETDFDNQWIELVKTKVFDTYHILTEQIYVVIDHTTLNYKYISDNFSSILGYPIAQLYEKGLTFVKDKMHPEDIAAFGQITSNILNTTRSLSPKDLLKCRLSFDFRMKSADGAYHRMLQHNIPLKVDESSNILQALAMLTDISPYKASNTCNYQVAQYNGTERVILAQGAEISLKGGNKISTREHEIIALTAQGLTEQSIADRLNISIYTVKTHRKNLFRKTGTKNATELVKFGMSNLLI